MHPLASLLLFLLLLLLFPFVFANLMLASLSKLQLSPQMALVLLVGIFLGSLVNIPVKSIVREQDVIMHPLAIFGLGDIWPRLRRVRSRTVIAVNVGGCVIPAGLALYQIAHLAALGLGALMAVAAATLANVLVCYMLARPVQGLGIVMPGFVSPLASVVFALLLFPDMAAPVAFVAGVLGPLIGADLLHLKDVHAIQSGIVSIGGAGTFDGIVLSGIIAAYLA